MFPIDRRNPPVGASAGEAARPRFRRANAAGMLGAEGRRALVRRVASSAEFEKSARLREFLAYVCERSMQAPGTEIHEQEIGREVFGKEPNYDTGHDNIVRVTASQLRKKLDKYFAAEGASEPFVLEVPRGQYAPAFRERPARMPGNAEAPIDLALLNPPAGPQRLILALGVSTVIFAVMAAAFGTQWRRLYTAAHPAQSQSLNAAWSGLFPAKARLNLIVPEASRDAGVERPTSVASVAMAYRIAGLLGDRQGEPAIGLPGDFSDRQIQEDNLILLGNPRTNRWMQAIEDRLDFRVVFDPQARAWCFENRRPQAGESGSYRDDGSGAYARIVYLPNAGGRGNLLAVTGNGAEGVETGNEFVTDEGSVAKLWRSGAPGPAAYFEALVWGAKTAGGRRQVKIAAFHRERK